MLDGRCEGGGGKYPAMRLETEAVMHRVTLYQINSVLLSCYTIASRRAEQYLSFDRWAALVLIITPLTYILHDVKEEEAVPHGLPHQSWTKSGPIPIKVIIWIDVSIRAARPRHILAPRVSVSEPKCHYFIFKVIEIV